MLRPILTVPSPSLLEPSKPIVFFDERLRLLVADMVETMYASGGVGLAAPQIGVNIALFVWDLNTNRPAKRDAKVCANPELQIVEKGGTAAFPEGCLSVPDKQVVVTRPRHLIMRCQDLDGKWREEIGIGLVARVWGHEESHLKGELISE